ncbi:MAG: lipoate-protein ligase [Bacteriovoracaceae bacterium]|nr:lipoate-protein ligase [Bacteriovoracaceae bacterium]
MAFSSELEFISFLGKPELSYSDIWEFQKDRVDAVSKGISPETIIFCEHERVLTAGRRFKSENVLDKTLPLFEIERGGDVTLHAPGQLVIYPILKLNSGRFPGGLHEYLRFIEQVTMDNLKKLGLEAGRFGPTGVWIKNKNGEEKKIASLGIAVRHWITYHGLAINVSNDLADFQKLRPCDFESSIMTSLANEGVTISLHALATEIQNLMEVDLKKRFEIFQPALDVAENYY